MSKKLTWIGIAITAGYLIAAALLGWGEWDKFSQMKPNEVGDFLAGVVGPLALLWLILGYFQQGEELRQSSLALVQQAEELRRSVEQQQALVEVTRAQVDAHIRSFQAETDRWRSLEQPILVPSLRKTDRDADGTYNFLVRCRNDGKGATEVSVEAKGRLVAVNPRWFPDFPNGSEVLFDLVDLEPDNFDPVELLFAYSDASGHHRQLTKVVYFHPEPPSGYKTIRFAAAPDSRDRPQMADRSGSPT